jgi:hypothetical protein
MTETKKSKRVAIKKPVGKSIYRKPKPKKVKTYVPGIGYIWVIPQDK